MSINNEFYKIEDVPEIPPAIEEASSKGKLVVFVGAGVSRLIDDISWDRFAFKYLNHIHDKGCINFREKNHLKDLNDPKKILSICKKIIKEQNLTPYNSKDLFEKNKDKENTRIYDDLYSLNAIYITTNYDNYLDEVAIEKNEKKYNDNGIYYKDKDLLISKLENGNIIHIHGSIEDEKSMVVSVVDYMNKYVRDSEVEDLLKEIFNHYTVLFVGYGLEEYEILEFIINKSNVGDNEIEHYFLKPMFKEDEKLYKLLDKYYSSLGIKLKPYNISENGYDQLSVVIRKWSERLAEISGSKEFIEKVRIVDEVVK